MARTTIDTITDVFTKGTLDDLSARLNEIKKQIEKNLIRNVYAPQVLNKRDIIKSNAEKKISEVAKEGKSALKGINDTLDGAIKGQWSTAVRDAVEKQVKDMMRYNHKKQPDSLSSCFFVSLGERCFAILRGGARGWYG